MGGFFEASALLDLNRLPELFCYPVTCSPQAWSAGAVFPLLQSSMGLSIDATQNRIVLTHPVLPDFLAHVSVRNIVVGAASVDLMLFRSGNTVAVTVQRRSGAVEVLVVN
jgi:glycogen debranching enzyme